jgi:hypothetical protein
LAFCPGGSVVLTSSPAASYLWSNGSSSQTIQAFATGSFRVTVTDANLCVDSSAVITVTVYPLPDSTITPNGSLTFCSGNDRILSGPSGMYSYVWSNGMYGQSILVNASGTYGLTVTDFNNCVNSSEVIVTVNQSPNPSLIPVGSTTFCEGDSAILVASGGTSYLWNTGATSSSIKVDTSGLYSVQVSTFGTCTASPLSRTITRVPMPVPIITSSGLDTICAGQSVTVYASGAQYYNWSFGSNSDSVIITSTKLNFTLTGFNGPNNMCSVTTSPYTVLVASKPSVYYTDSKTIKCPEDTAVFSASSVSNVSYQWHLNGSPVVGETNSVFKTTGAGSVYMVATNEFGCFDTSATRLVSYDVLPKPTLSYDPNKNYMYTNDSSYYNRIWTRNDTIIPGANGNTYKAEVNGVHRVWVRSKSFCSTASDPFNYTWVSTEVMVTVSNWNAFPNPASDYIRITTEGEDADFVLTDMQGRALRTGFISGAGEVMVQDLPAGVYHLKVTSGNRLAQFKIQVMH